MKITLEPTTKIVVLEGGSDVLARVWEGTTDAGEPIHAYITRIAAPTGEHDEAKFERELVPCRDPTPGVAAIPARLIL